MEIWGLLLIIFVGMPVLAAILFGWAIVDDYKSGHTRHEEKFFGNDD